MMTAAAIELRDLRWVIVAAKHRSLRQAAEALHIRQSTLSRRLRDVEYRLGATLFERSNGGTRPTAAGYEFLEAARRIVEEADTVFSRLRTRGRGENGQLTIGVYASLSTGNLRATLTDHHRRFPDVDVYMIDGGHDRLMCDLITNAIDIAIMTTCGPSWDDRRLPLWSERVIVAMPAQHPFCARSMINWSDLANERMLFPQRGPGPELERLLTAKLHGSGPQRILHHDVSLDRLLSLVGAEYGMLLMLEGATGVHYEGVIYREVHEEEGPTRLDFTAYWRQANNNPTLEPFLAMLRERHPDLSAGT
ncbi:LysR family transcriptional regulator [Bosea sp. (in: a-proteobacteria)]|uniref:LysR substrate-binding domain-containing protein n=1 Tax=Bosea sp. (in: a-proteobacteria) TaxID=1871050 RepID=UPI0025C71A2D|nr:LysR family transcriptional regulator [Bosea sp. (in: a-proteobacteria)]